MNHIEISSSSNGDIIRQRHSLTKNVIQSNCEKIVPNNQDDDDDDVSSFEGNIIQYLQKYDSWAKTAVFFRWLLADEGMTAIVPVFIWIIGGTEGILLLTNLVLNELLNGCIKWICQRPRPFWTNSNVKNIAGSWEEDFAFPSSHAQISACFFSCILFQYGLADCLHQKMNFSYLLLFIFLLLLVFTTGITRVYLGVHYPSDVIVGWIIGLGMPIALQSLDLFTWFRKLGTPYHFYFSIVVPFLLYSLFATIRFLVRKPQCVSTWEKTAHRNELIPSSKTIQMFRLSKYNIQIWSLAGGLLGTSMAIEDDQLRFIFEACHWEQILPYSLPRTLLGYGVFIFLLFPFTFVLPMIFSRRRVLSLLLKSFGAFLIGWWALYGCPKLADITLNASCPLRPLLVASSIPKTEIAHLELYTSHHTNLFRPTSIEELQAFVRKQDSQSTTLRVFGSGYSQLFDQTTSSSKNTVYIQLSAPAFTKYEIHSIAEKSIDQHIFIEAGVGLHLDENKYMNISREDSLLYKMSEDNLSLDNLPTILQQTLGSVISTGSEDRSFHSFFKQIIGLRLIDGRGNLRVLWRNATENIEFQGALLSMGLMGILVSVIIAPSPQFCVTHSYHQTNNSHEQIHALINQIEHTLTKNDYSGYYIFPTAQPSTHEYPVMITNSFKMNRISCNDSSKPKTFFDHLEDHFIFSAPVEPTTLNTHGISLDLYAASHSMIETVDQSTLDLLRIVLPSSQIFDLHEIYFPIFNTSYLKQVLKIYLTEIITQPEHYISEQVFTEIHACPASDALMSPTRGLPSICFSIICMNCATDTSVQVYRKFWQLFQRHGLSFTVHWGKTLPTHQQDRTTWNNIRAQYQDNDTLTIFKTLVENFDPTGVFRNAYWYERFWAHNS